MSTVAARVRLGAGMTLLALGLAACAGTAPSATTGATAVPTAADRTPGTSGAPELAAMLPSSAGGVDFVTSSATADDLAGLGISLNETVLEAAANSRQLTLSDVQVAEARPRDATKGGLVLAIRVPGADAKSLVDATFSSANALRLRTLGGKSVYEVAGSGLGVVVYIKDDIVFQVVGAPADLHGGRRRGPALSVSTAPDRRPGSTPGRGVRSPCPSRHPPGRRGCVAVRSHTTA